MKKTTISLAMATPCPNRNIKRPMSRGKQARFQTLKPRLILLLTLILSLTANFSFAQTQNQPLKGTVTDAQHNPLIGATLTETASKQTAQTDAKGQFSLPTTTQTGRVTISYLGYQPKTIRYQTDQPLSVQLLEEPSTLRTVQINAGYYSTTEKLSTGSISSVKAGDIEKQPVSNPLSALQGRITGAYIQQTSGTPGGGITLVIRGQNGIETSSTPLYILDGVPYNASAQFSSLTGSGAIYSTAGPSPLSNIAPEEILSIEILKDADATAIYGSRGANGVVLITTKKHQNGSPTIQLSTQAGISQVARSIEMMGTADYLALRKTAIALDGSTIKATDYDLNGTWDQNAQTDWQKDLFGHTAHYNSTRLAIGGGSAKHSFQASASHNRQGNTYAGDLGYTRSSVHVSSSHQNTDQSFKANFSALYAADQTDWLNGDNVSRGVTLSPNAPTLRNPDGSLNWASSSWINPLRQLENRYKAENDHLTASLQLAYRPIQNLNLQATLGYASQQLRDGSSLPVSYYDPAEGRTPATSTSDFGHAELSSWTIEPQASYSLNKGKSAFSILIGTSFQQQQNSQQLIRGTGFASDALLEHLDAAATANVRGHHLSTYRYAAGFARLNYNYGGKYLLNLTARRDASSRFGPSRSSATFGALGIAYLLSEEKFIKEKFPFLSFAKLRASYGTSGNDQIGDYEYLNTYQSITGYNGVSALRPVRLFNPDFGWEINKKAEIGLDFGLFSDQLSGTAGYFRNRSSSQLIDYPLAMSTGFSSIRANLNALIENSGWEFQLTARPKAKGKLSYSFTANLTLPRNKLLEFPGLASSSYANTYVIGQPLSIQKLYALKGVNPQTGLYEFIDQNRDGLINSSDRTVIKRRGQSAYGGLGTTLRYGGLELDILLQGVSQTMTNLRNHYTTMPGRMSNQPNAYLGQYWLKPGDIAPMQRPSSGSNSAANAAQSNYTSSEAVNSDASFIRLKTISLGYRTTRLIPGKAVKFSLQGQNLYTWTDYLGLDPENASLSLPPLRTITLSLNLNL